MSTNGLTDHDLTQLLTPTRASGGVMELHYFNTLFPAAPALCGTMPDGGSWANHYRPGAAVYTPQDTMSPAYEMCPACQVRYSYMGAAQRRKDGGK